MSAQEHMEIVIGVENLEDSKADPREEKFGQAEVTIGRGKTNDLILTAPDVSSRHAKIYVETDPESSEPALFLIDLGSSNGTYVEDVRIPEQQPLKLRDGQRVVVGAFMIAPNLLRVPAAESAPGGPSSTVETPRQEKGEADGKAELPPEKAPEKAAGPAAEKTPEKKEAEPPAEAAAEKAEKAPEKPAELEVKPEPPPLPPVLPTPVEELPPAAVVAEPKQFASTVDPALPLLLENLRALQTLAASTSHVLRTPLSVAMSTMADAKAAGEVDAQVLRDGEQAHQAILDKLHFLKTLGAEFKFEPKKVQLDKLVIKEFGKRDSFRGIPCEVDPEAKLPAVKADAELVKRSVEALLLYLVAKCNAPQGNETKPEQPGKTGPRLVIQLAAQGDRVVLTIELNKPEAAKLFANAGTEAMLTVGFSEHLVESVALVYADAVARIHGGMADVCIDGEERVSLKLRYPAYSGS